MSVEKRIYKEGEFKAKDPNVKNPLDKMSTHKEQQVKIYHAQELSDDKYGDSIEVKPPAYFMVVLKSDHDAVVKALEARIPSKEVFEYAHKEVSGEYVGFNIYEAIMMEHKHLKYENVELQAKLTAAEAETEKGKVLLKKVILETVHIGHHHKVLELDAKAWKEKIKVRDEAIKKLLYKLRLYCDDVDAIVATEEEISEILTQKEEK